jgi:YjbR
MMADDQDPTTPLRKAAAAFPSVTEGTSCNQTSFKAGKQSFLFVGPGPKGIGFKAMFKLKSSRREAEQLAADQPERFEVGSSAWVTTRFSADTPLPIAIWQKWLQESYELSCPSGAKPRGRSKVAGK